MLSCLLLKCLLIHLCVIYLKGLQIQLYWVSTNPFIEIENLYGSTQGGTSLYLKAVGFDSIISNNVILVGTYSCIIDETYIKDQELSCKTIAPALNDNSLQNLVVTVGVPGQQISVCTSQKNKCLFSYIKEKSPYLHYLIPNIGFANSVLFSKGSYTIEGEENNEIEKIFIGQEFCRKSQYRLLNSGMILKEDVISCQLAENLISQTYQVKIETRRGNFLQQKTLKILPIITSLSEKVEMADSFQLKINGYGFKSGLTDNQVKLSGTDVIIKVLEAQINQLKVEIPKITDQTKLDLLSNQDLIFISGTGLLHTKYDLRGITTQYPNCDIFRNEVIQESQILKDRIIQNGVYSQPDYIDEIDSQYGQYFRGFIKATATGQYQFLLSADDCATFYIQTTETLKTTRAESPNAQSFKSTQYRNYWGEQLWDNTKNVNSISQTINLEENQYYYIEIFHLNTEGKGFLTLSMNTNVNQISTINTKQSQLFQVKTSYTPIYEILQMNIYNSIENTILSESFKLKFKNINQDINTFSFITQDITFSFTNDQIQQALLTCCNYIAQVQIKKLDNLGQVVDDTSEIYAGHQYTITFLSHRGKVEERSLPEIQTQQQQLIFNVQTIQEPLDPISGYFKLSVQYLSQIYNFVNENNSEELPFNVDSNILAQNFYRITGQKPIVWNEGRAQDGQIWNILFSTCQITIQSFQQKDNKLLSGNGNVQLDVQNLKTCNSQLYEPISALQLFTYGRMPQIQVSTSEGQGACQKQGVCDFNFKVEDQLMLQSYTMSNEIMQLNFVILSQNQLNLYTNDFTIEFRGASCLDIQKINSDSSQFKITCKLETQNSKIVQESGLNQYPKIYHVVYGYIKIDTKITALKTYIIIESVTPNSGSPDGGVEIVILGSGFPKDLSRTFQLQMGSTKIIPLFISNTKIIFIHPSGNDGKITIEYNGITQYDYSFIYDAALTLQISSLDITQIIPTYRGVVKITGKNFGTVKEDVKAFIQNQELQVISVQDQLMSVQFNKNLDISTNNVIQVYRKNYGRTTNVGTQNVNIINIALNVTSGGTVVDGYIQTLIQGGTLIQITGTNLDSASAVVFGQDNATVCLGMKKNQTSIYCNSPPNIFKRQTDQIYIIHQFKYQVTCTKCIAKYSRTLIIIQRLLMGSKGIAISELEYKIRYLQLWSEEAKLQVNNPLLYYKQSKQVDPLLFYDITQILIIDLIPGDSLVVNALISCKPVSAFLNLQFIQSSTITVAGQRVPMTTNCMIQNSNQYNIIYTVPELTQGLHLTQLSDYLVNDQRWYTRIGLAITQVSEAAIGGALFTIQGYGFNQLYLKNIKVGDNECQKINVISTVKLQCIMKAKLTPGENSLIVNQLDQQDKNTLLSKSCTFNVKDEINSPKVKSILIDGIDKLDITQNANVCIAGTINMSIQGQNLKGVEVAVLLISGSETIIGSIILAKLTSTLIELQLKNTPIGIYQIEIRIDNVYVYFENDAYANIIVNIQQTPIIDTPQLTYQSGQIINYIGDGFSSNPLSNQIQFCEANCKVISSSFNNIKFIVPILLTSQFISSIQYSKIPIYELNLLGDKIDLIQNIYDNSILTEYTSDSQETCFIQLNIKQKSGFLKLAKLRFYLKQELNQNKFKKIKIYYSTDDQNWQQLYDLKYINQGWNTIIPDIQIDQIRSIKFEDDQGNLGSQCSLSEIELYGWIYYNENLISNCQIDINVNGIKVFNNANTVSYAYQNQPIVNTVTPKYGPINSETLITIKGNGFINEQTTVTIDNVTCVLVKVSITEITCKTGLKTVLTDNSGFIVQVQNNPAIIKSSFKYVQKWSDISSWNDRVPTDYESVLITNSKTILLDVKQTIIDRLIIEGTLILSDEIDINLIANSIIIREGSLIIGSKDQPYQHQVIITLTGQETDTQFPLIGNKGIGCIKCKIQMYGQKRNPYWSFLDSKATKGDVIIKLSQIVDWQVGESIVIATSSGNIEENEIRIIQTISSDKKSITLDKPLLFTHQSELLYQTEVALLSRNILIKAESKVNNGYGVHFHINGRQSEGTVVQISNIEISNGGQSTFVGRYPIHFYNNEEMDLSIIENNSIHDSYARCIVLNNVKHLKIINNICFNIIGNAIHLVSSSDVYNRIESNLVLRIKSIQYIDNSCSFFNYQSYKGNLQDVDRLSSAFYISNPHNVLLNNRAIAGDYIGFNIFINRINNHNYQIMEPLAWDVLNIQSNFIHSIMGYGVQISILLENEQIFTDKEFQLSPVLKLFTVWQNNINDFNIVIRTQNQRFESQINFLNAETIDFNIISSSLFTTIKNSLIFKIKYTNNNQKYIVYRFRDKKFNQVVETPNPNSCQMGDWYNDQVNKYLYVCISGEKVINSQPIKIKGSICVSEDQCNLEMDNDKCDKLYSEQMDDSGNQDTGSNNNGSQDTGNNNSGNQDTGNSNSGNQDTGNNNSGNQDTGNNNSGNQDNNENNDNTNENNNTNNNYKWSSPQAWQTNKIPQFGDKVVIRRGYQITLDVDPPQLDELIIEGTLNFDEKRESSLLQSKTIFIKQGQIIAGNKENPFLNKITIKTSNFQISNSLQLYSTVPKTYQTRLVQTVSFGSNQIEVLECLDWQIGDKIVLGPSGTKWDNSEEKTIINKQNCVITLDSPLKYDYYGDRSITISKNNIGQLDMRTLVVHLNRKIKIQNSDINKQGSIQIKHGLIDDEIYIGQIILQGVEIQNFGQLQKAGLIFENLFFMGSQSIILGCSFNDANGIFLKISNSYPLQVENNVFYSGIKTLVEIVNQIDVKFKNNILINVKRSETKDWAVLASFLFSQNNIEVQRSSVDISDNIGQGSEDAGFYIVSSQCNSSNEANIYNNVCSSAENSCFSVRHRFKVCDSVSDLYAYHSKIGIMFALSSYQLEIKRFITAENKINLILKGSSREERNNIMKISDGFITAIARPNCINCYENVETNYCSGTLGMQLATISSQSFPPIQQDLLSDKFDQIISEQVIDLRVFVNNVEFNQFKVNNNKIPNCVENAVLRQHPKAIDMTGRHYLKYTRCTECEFESLLYRLRDSNFSQVGKSGGCGLMECTGQKNVLIEDQTGDFFGEIGQGITNNTIFGKSVKYCKRVEQWNGYWCPGRKIQVLNFMSTAPDQNSRVFSPVYLSDGTFKNVINSCYEWQQKPIKIRQSKFLSLIQLNSIIKLNTTGYFPTSSTFWLSKNLDSDGSDYSIISLKFDNILIPNVYVNGKRISDDISTNICGSNSLLLSKKEINFTVTSEIDCFVDLKFKNYLSTSSVVVAQIKLASCYIFVVYFVDVLKVDPNLVICYIANQQNRRLEESDLAQITIEWAIIDDADPGTQESKGSLQRLSQYIETISQLTPNPEYGIHEIISQTYETHIITELNFPSSEPIELIDSSVSNPIIYINTTNPDSTLQDLDSITLSENESVNQDQQVDHQQVIISKDQNMLLNNNDENQDQSVIIILSIIIPLILVIIITYFCLRKLKQRRNSVVIPINQIQQQDDTTNNKLPDTTFMYRSAVKTPKTQYIEKIEFVTKV